MRAQSMQASSRRRRSGETAARRIMRERSGGICEVCGNARATEAAHRIARSQMGAWRASNLLHLCHDCHSAQRESSLARSLGQTLHPWTDGAPTDPERVPVQTRYGRVLLDDDGGWVPAGDEPC